MSTVTLDPSFTYQVADIYADPTSFDQRIITALKARYSSQLNRLFDELRLEIRHNALMVYTPKFTRHLFPAFVTADSIGEIDDGYLSLCKACLLGYSLPILALDDWADQGSPLDSLTLSEGIHSIYSAQVILHGLPNGEALVIYLNQVYSQITESILFELESRYRFIQVDLETDFEHGYYRSLCGYLSAFVGATLLYYNQPISECMRRYLRLFGVLRQVVDEIADVEEDLSQGNVTLPFLFAHQQVNLQGHFQRFWQGRLAFSGIHNILLETGAYEACYAMAMRLYERTCQLQEELKQEYPRLFPILGMFYDLKLCQLLRIQRNSWQDNLKKYR